MISGFTCLHSLLLSDSFTADESVYPVCLIYTKELSIHASRQTPRSDFTVYNFIVSFITCVGTQSLLYVANGVFLQAPNILRKRHAAKESQHSAWCLCVWECVFEEKGRGEGVWKSATAWCLWEMRNRGERERRRHLEQVKQQKWNFSLSLPRSVFSTLFMCQNECDMFSEPEQSSQGAELREARPAERATWIYPFKGVVHGSLTSCRMSYWLVVILLKLRLRGFVCGHSSEIGQLVRNEHLTETF